MFEKVNPCHPDKVADRIAGAIIDYAYSQQDNPKIAVEVLVGHGICTIHSETSVSIDRDYVESACKRICKDIHRVDYYEHEQAKSLADNQKYGFHCGDNGIFKGVPTTNEQQVMTSIAQNIYSSYPFDGKYIYDENLKNLIICQSHATHQDVIDVITEDITANHISSLVVNPLGYWDGGINEDTGATNRKLGSDMGDAVTGGGLMGKDCSKADVSVNIYLHLLAAKCGHPFYAMCSIGDDSVMVFDSIENGFQFVEFSEIVKVALDYIKSIGGFEKFAEWGLIN